MKKKQISDPAAWLSKIIKDYVCRSPKNSLQNQSNDKAFAEPLIGFASGIDPLFDEYKEHVGPFHWTPP